jgi:adenine phosphoribosyltransferase
MNDADLAAVRQLVLGAFRWVDGHADLSRVFRSADVLSVIGAALAAPFGAATVTVVVSPEARGFVLGALVARELGIGLVLVRKHGSHHPGASVQVRTAPDWRGRELVLRLHPDALRPTDRVLVVDDWIETGSQATAIQTLITRCGAQVVGVAAPVDDTTQPTRRRLNLHGLLRSAELPADEHGTSPRPQHDR